MKAVENQPERVAYPLHLISGLTHGNNFPIKIAYVGRDDMKLVQWSSLIGKVLDKRMVGEVPVAGIMKLLTNQYPECSLLLVEKDLIGHDNLGMEGFSLPYFMQSVIDLSVPIDLVSNRCSPGFANAARRIRKFKMTWEIDNTPEAQHDFYYHMYGPYLSARYGETFQGVSFHNVFSTEIPFELMRVKSGDEVLAAGVFRIKSGKAYFSFLGVREGKFENVQKGALSALYYFLYEELRRRGFDKLYLGGSPPFLFDSVTKHKIRMTARIDKDYLYQNQELISLFLLKNCEGTNDFLCRSPLISIDRSGRARGVIWLGNPEETLDMERVHKEIDTVFRFGLDVCEIVFLHNFPSYIWISKYEL